MMESPQQTTAHQLITRVDTHVHIYDDYDLSDFLEQATEQPNTVLCLTESAGHHYYDSLLSTESLPAGWACEEREQGLLHLSMNQQQVWIVAGSQIVSEEKLEVLSLCNTHRIPDGLPIEQIIDEINQVDGVAVLPWGVGKWFGKRGEIIGKLIQTSQTNRFCLADISGRPITWPRPTWLRRGERNGFSLLTGTDPLPLKVEQGRVASAGCLFEQSDPEISLNALKDKLRKSSRHNFYGKRISTINFIKSQHALRQNKQVTSAVGEKDHSEPADIETASAEYAKRFAGDWGEYLLSVQGETVHKAMKGSTVRTVLEVGGGHGQLVKTYQHNNWDITIHGSEPVCFERIDQEHVKCVQGDFFSLPFEDRQFDLVVAIRLLPHVDDWPKLIQEMCRVSKSTVIVEYPALYSFNILTPLLFKLKKGFEGDTRDYGLFRHTEVNQVFKENGFALSWKRGQFFLPIVIHRMLKAARPVRILEKVFGLLGLSKYLGSPVIFRADRYIE